MGFYFLKVVGSALAGLAVAAVHKRADAVWAGVRFPLAKGARHKGGPRSR